jgi:hypothetical protein
MPRANSRSLLTAIVLSLLTLVLTACGGGGGGGGFSSSSSGSSSSGGSSSSSSSSSSGGTPPTELERIAAADKTAASTTNACGVISAIAPFYWEIGKATGQLTGRTEPSGASSPDATTVMPLYSASKWLFSAFVVQKRGGFRNLLPPDDVPALTMTSGYVNMLNDSCLSGQTVQQCYQSSTGAIDGTQASKFHYNSGHFQFLGTQGGLGIESDTDVTLSTTMKLQLGTDLTFTWNTPELAGGATDSAGDYAVFLRKILSGTLLMGAALGQDAVETSPTKTGCSDGVTTCVPGEPFASESAHYSLGHWVEDDASGAGDRAFSSPGYAGFYPWIWIDSTDPTMAWYGIVARTDTSSIANGFTASINCGRLIRRAWLTGTPQ